MDDAAHQDLIQVPPGVTLDFARHTHEYIREYIQMADQKAAFVFATGSALLAFLYSNQASQAWLRNPLTWATKSFVSLIAMFGLAIAAALAVAVVVPRRRGSRRGFIFWESIVASGSSSAYANRVAGLAEAEIAREQLHHCYELAFVCQRKYNALARAMWAGAVGGTATVVYLLFS
jgi:hypothetical protein